MRRASLACIVAATMTCACGREEIELHELPELPAVSAPAPSSPPVDATAGAEAELGDEELVLRMSACLRRSALAVSEAWDRLELDVDPATGRPQRDRKDQQPFIPPLKNTLLPCTPLPEAPQDPTLHAAHLQYGPYRESTVAIATKLEELASYFDARTYEGDDWAFSHATIVPLAAQVEDWEQRAEALRLVLQPARISTLQGMLRAHMAESPDAPATIAIAVMLESEQFALCVRGDELARCSTSEARVGDLIDRLEATLAATPAGGRPQFWTRALASAGRAFAEQIHQVQGALKRGHLGAAQRRELDASRMRLEKAADTVRRGLGPLQGAPPTPPSSG